MFFLFFSVYRVQQAVFRENQQLYDKAPGCVWTPTKTVQSLDEAVTIAIDALLAYQQNARIESAEIISDLIHPEIHIDKQFYLAATTKTFTQELKALYAEAEHFIAEPLTNFQQHMLETCRFWFRIYEDIEKIPSDSEIFVTADMYYRGIFDDPQVNTELDDARLGDLNSAIAVYKEKKDKVCIVSSNEVYRRYRYSPKLVAQFPKEILVRK